jgi:hypothetical protein
MGWPISVISMSCSAGGLQMTTEPSRSMTMKGSGSTAATALNKLIGLEAAALPLRGSG